MHKEVMVGCPKCKAEGRLMPLEEVEGYSDRVRCPIHGVALMEYWERDYSKPIRVLDLTEIRDRFISALNITEEDFKS